MLFSLNEYVACQFPLCNFGLSNFVILLFLCCGFGYFGCHQCVSLQRHLGYYCSIGWTFRANIHQLCPQIQDGFICYQKVCIRISCNLLQSIVITIVVTKIVLCDCGENKRKSSIAGSLYWFTSEYFSVLELIFTVIEFLIISIWQPGLISVCVF